ncbi:MAG: ATP-dependent metallopeptidase FtsH/Yme1/Tma family protein, partial [Thiohalobacterales bacterium]|nr:ATP-dependent metallopeptidase FtsH/Yme1/Tma family protein [Thiohalobacterales bacterium]
MNDLAKNLILWVVIAIVLMSVFNNFGPTRTGSQTITYSEFITEVQTGLVKRVDIEGHSVEGLRADGSRFQTQTPPDDPKMVDDLLSNNVAVNVKAPNQQSLLMQIFISWFPMLLL